MPRVRSEVKIQKFIDAARDKIETASRPDVILCSKEFIESLKYNEIDPATLCRFGCPRFYLPKIACLCNDTKTTASYSAKCADCWFLALTEERELTSKKAIRKPDEEGFKELLQILGYRDGMDFNKFLLDTKRKLK